MSYEGMYVHLGTGRGDGILRYAIIAGREGVVSGAPVLRGWRIRHEDDQGGEAAIGTTVHRTVVTDENNYRYLFERHETRTGSDGFTFMIGRLLPLQVPVFQPGQSLWLRSYAPPWEDEPAPVPVTYVRLEDEGHVVRLGYGGHVTVVDDELSAVYPSLRKAVPQDPNPDLADWERDLLGLDDDEAEDA